MDKLRLKNYRCFEDTEDVELKPITLLLGANSSGKSSFLKFFPLLQQSLETKVNGLFLWDGQYVDFKNFKNTVRNGKGEITIEYTIGEMASNSYYTPRLQYSKNVVLSMTISEIDDDYDYLKELEISLDQICYKYIFSKDGKCLIDVNGIKSEDYPGEKVVIEYDNNLLPSVRFSVSQNDFRFVSIIPQSALSELNKFLGKDDKSGFELLLDEREPALFTYNYQKIKEELRKRNPNAEDADVERAANVQTYLMAGQIVGRVNDYFSEMSRNFSYVLPLRSIMNRYYRFQNRAVETIDPNGDNLTMFLNSLTEKKFNDFNSWLSDIFHFKLSVQKTESHVEMCIEEEGKPKRNLVDVGFGFTQILPILTIIWKSVYGGNLGLIKRKKIPITIVIEQPELHLHPRFQSFFGLMLAKVMKFSKSQGLLLRIIIETHSEVIVNKLGQLIADPREVINENDVNVVLFHANSEGLVKYVHTTGFSKDGGLISWPFGFFSEDVY